MIKGFIGDYIGSYFEGMQWVSKEGNFFDLNTPINKILPDPIDGRTVQGITDDTVCTLGLYKAYLEGARGFEAAKILADFCKEHIDIGFGGGFKKWIENPIPYESYANGCIMRLGFLKYVPIEERFELALNYTNISHNHPESIEAVTDYVSLMNDKSILSDLMEKRGVVKSVEDYHNDAKFVISAKGTFNQVLAILNESSSFEDILHNCLYIGGDTDTLACIACSLSDYDVPEYLVEKLMKDQTFGAVYMEIF